MVEYCPGCTEISQDFDGKNMKMRINYEVHAKEPYRENYVYFN